jgi:hypothetical protein
LFLSKKTTKGHHYLYLQRYQVRDHYKNLKLTVFRFGRLESAKQQMYAWRENFNEFPKELIDLGCTKRDLEVWIVTIETGVHKTGRKLMIS